MGCAMSSLQLSPSSSTTRLLVNGPRPPRGGEQRYMELPTSRLVGARNQSCRLARRQGVRVGRYAECLGEPDDRQRARRTPGRSPYLDVNTAFLGLVAELDQDADTARIEERDVGQVESQCRQAGDTELRDRYVLQLRFRRQIQFAVQDEYHLPGVRLNLHLEIGRSAIVPYRYRPCRWLAGARVASAARRSGLTRRGGHGGRDNRRPGLVG